MQKVVTQLKRHSVVNPESGRIDLRYNPMSIEEDYFIPVRAGSATDIVSLPGASNITAIDDIKYLRDKMFSALKIPQSYLTMGEGAEEDKTTLAQKDIRFARTIQRLQRVIIAELTKISIIHLYTLGFRGDDLLGFSLSLNNPSRIAELQELEHWKTKFETAAAATEGFFSRRWVAEHVFALSHEEFLRCQREMYYDRKHDAALQGVAEAAAAGETAALGGGLGGELGGEMGDLGGEELGAPEEMPAGEAEAGEAGGGEESALLAAPPGSRSAPRLTPGSRGKVYHPVKTDKRKSSGPRARSNASSHGQQQASSTFRNILPGYADGLKSLAKGFVPTSEGIYEEEQSIYSLREKTEENRLFEVNNSVKSLIEDLEKKETLEQKNESETQQEAK